MEVDSEASSGQVAQPSGSDTLMETLMSMSDAEESGSEGSEGYEDMRALREDMMVEVESGLEEYTEAYLKRTQAERVFPPDFMMVYEMLTEPKTMMQVNLSDSDSDDDWEGDMSNDPKCNVPSCNSRKRAEQRSRLITSYFGLSYVESPFICHKCFMKACKFYCKIAKIGPDKCKFLINDNVSKGCDYIDISEDRPAPKVDVEMLEDDSLATEVFKDIQIHLHKVSQKYNLEEKHSSLLHKMESKIGKMTVWINELLCKLEMDDSAMVNLLQDVYSTFTPELQEEESVDMDIVDADNPEMKKNWDQAKREDKSTIVIDSYSDPDIAIVEGSVDGGLKKPSNLPPRGIIARKKPCVGQKVFVSRQAEQNDWIPAVVQSIIISEIAGQQDNNLVYRYRVQVSEKSNPDYDYIKDVEEEQMAYFEPSPVRIAVGNRVISAVYSKTNPESVKYHSGLVAESPSSNNQYRYMILFDSMAVQYSKHEDLRVTCEMKENIHHYFPLPFQLFVRKYFEMLPKRKILTVNTMDIIKVELKGRWVDGKVTAVDGLLMEVFYKQGQPTEWLYRGSPRVMSKEMYKSKLIRAYADGTIKPVQRGGVFAEDDPVEVNKVIEMLASKSGGSKYESGSGDMVRAVAKKTTARLPDSLTTTRPLLVKQGSSVYQSRSNKDEFAGYVRAVKDLTNLFPRDLGVHECNEECISWTNKTLDMCRGKNPLVVPMLFAFRRRVDVSPVGGGAKQIFYESPCGKKLEDFDQLLAYLQKTKCQLSVDYFNFDSWVSVWDEFKAASGGLVLMDLSYGKEFNMISVVNTVDKELPPYMNYKVSRIATDGVPLNLDPEFLTCCDCTDDCANKMKCPCWQRTIRDYQDLIVKSNSEIDSSANVMDYSYIGYQNKRLVEHVPSGIYECNSMCHCSHTCLNRVVQLPLKVKLELFKTKYKGWGTRCLNDIPAGGFICVYVGNLLTEKAANEGGKTYGDEYFAELDYIEVMETLMNKAGYESGPSDPENTDEEAESGLDDSIEGQVSNSSMKLRSRKKDKDKKNRVKRSTTDTSQLQGIGTRLAEPNDGGTAQPADKPETEEPKAQNPYIPLRTLYGNNESVYIIDAKSAGNIGRYFNHSCEPNIFVQNVFVDTHDLRFPWVAFFAKHYIRAGTELTWDYQYIVDSVPGKKLYCYCRSKTCRGRLL